MAAHCELLWSVAAALPLSSSPRNASTSQRRPPISVHNRLMVSSSCLGCTAPTAVTLQGKLPVRMPLWIGEATARPPLPCPVDGFTVTPSLRVLMHPDDEPDGHVPTDAPDW